jgi:hypothetical protein
MTAEPGPLADAASDSLDLLDRIDDVEGSD